MGELLSDQVLVELLLLPGYRYYSLQLLVLVGAEGEVRLNPVPEAVVGNFFCELLAELVHDVRCEIVHCQKLAQAALFLALEHNYIFQYGSIVF